jgi:hypothetical protein
MEKHAGGVMAKTLHFRINTVSRNKVTPDNAVAACAYRVGLNLTDGKTGETHYYAKRGGVIRTAIFAPGAAPGWMLDEDQARAWERFGNEIEAVEDGHNRRASAMLAKDFHAAAPRELTHAQDWQVAERFARKLNERGLAVAVALHETDASDGGKNPHFHFLVGMRRTDKNGFSTKKERWLDSKPGTPNPEIMALRRAYFQAVNDALTDAGVTGIAYDPEKQPDTLPGKHKGKAAVAVERKEAERVKQARWSSVEAFLRPALASLQDGGETYQEGIGAEWWERAQAAMPQGELHAPLSWRDRMAPDPAPRSR